MKKLERIIEWYPDEEFLSADGFEKALIGIAYDKIKGVHVLIYSRMECIEILIERDEMSKEDAEEYFDYNVEGAYVGDKTPVFVDDMMFYDE